MSRPRARWLALAGLLVLGVLAAVRLPLAYLPPALRPELAVGLRLPEATGPDDVARRWLEPVEAAVRSLGDVAGWSGVVSADGAELVVRLTPGADPGRKTARLAAELAPLDRRLPPGGRLTVTPAGDFGGALTAVVWLAVAAGPAADADAEAAAESLRRLPGVRAVEVLGAGADELRVELDPAYPGAEASLPAVRAELRRALTVQRLGEVTAGDRRLPLIGGRPPGSGLEALPVTVAAADGRPLPLGTLARLSAGSAPPRWGVRFGGRPARALWVLRQPDASPLALDRRLRRALAALPPALRGSVEWSEAAPLASLLLRLALGALLATAGAAWVGGRLAGTGGALALAAAVPAAIAAALNAYLVAGVALDVTTLCALALGVAAALPTAARRLAAVPTRFAGLAAGAGVRQRPVPGGSGFATAAGFTVAAAAAIPVTAALAAGDLGPVVTAPARAFALAATAAVAAAALPPLPSVRRRRRRRSRSSAALRRVLRDPGSALLAAATAGAALLVVAGAALVPLPGTLDPDDADLRVVLALPAGTPASATGERLALLEERLTALPEVAGLWSRWAAGQAVSVVRLAAGHRGRGSRDRAATRVRYAVAGLGAVRVVEGAGPRGSFAAGGEWRTYADSGGHRYRAMLRSTDLGSLGEAWDRVVAAVAQQRLPSRWLAGRDRTEPRRVLIPRPGVPPAAAAELAATLARRSAPPPGLPLPAAGGRRRELVVRLAGDPEPTDPPPALAELLARPLPGPATAAARRAAGGGEPVMAAALADLAEEVVRPRVDRDGGRFVLPVEVSFGYLAEGARLEARSGLDRALSALALPAGVDLERPALDPWSVRLAGAGEPGSALRLAALAAGLALLLGALAAVRLDAPAAAAAVLIAAAAAPLAAAPVVRLAIGRADELTVVALAAATAAGVAALLPAAAALTGALRRAPGPPASAARALLRAGRTTAPGLLAAAPLPLLLLAVPCIGAEPGTAAWVAPLAAAGVAATAVLATAPLLLPALLLPLELRRRRDPVAERRRRRPPVWEAALPARLAAAAPVPDEAPAVRLRGASSPQLAVRALTKRYGPGPAAVDGVDFELGPGITGLLGPNGAGKTTLLRLLAGLLEPSRGSVLYRGVRVTAANLAAYRGHVGLLPQESDAYPGLTVAEFLDHWAIERGLRGERARRREIGRRLDEVGLGEHAGRRVRDLSGGMRRRVAVARALLGDPPLLLVDEPTTGLDIASRDRFRRVLLATAGERVVLFSTHLAGDVEAAAGRLLLLHRGRLRFDGPPAELIARARGRVFSAVFDDAELDAFSRAHRITARVRVLAGIRVRAVAAPGEPLAGEAAEPTLEEAYLAAIDRADAEDGVPRRSGEIDLGLGW